LAQNESYAKMTNREATIAVIGGSGLYEMDGLSGLEFVEIETPFGKPSDAIAVGSLDEIQVAFLPRHGRGHRLNPTHIPVRANIYALKSLGVRRIVSISAVGSLKEEFAPLDLVVPDQLIDRTKGRESTFFDEGMVVHVSFADPFCPVTSRLVQHCAQELGLAVHQGGTMVVMEGPAFSTRAESFMYRAWGADIIGMTGLPEAKLAREAEICYTTMAWVTDYDCWRQGGEAVTVEMVVENLKRNVAASQQLLRRVIPGMKGERSCACATSLKDDMITPPQEIPTGVKTKLASIVSRYLN
jgi:5'-methylthioadenosine phosphorylase